MENTTLTEPILRLDNVCYQYRNKYQSVDAVKDATAEFHEGKTYAIIGKSGSGKSTLLSLIAGLALPTDGQQPFTICEHRSPLRPRLIRCGLRFGSRLIDLRRSIMACFSQATSPSEHSKNSSTAGI